MPFKNVNGMSDVDTGEIFIADRLNHTETLDAIKHELAHIVSGDSDHTDKWRRFADKLNVNDYCGCELSQYRKMCNIPNHIGGNIGSILGYQGLLTDYYLLQSYRKFSQRILGTDGRWEYDHSAKSIRLFPTPRGAFPVIVRYLPIVTDLPNVAMKDVIMRAFTARVKQAVGYARRKLSGLPGPDGGSINTDGEALVREGAEELEKIQSEIILLGEPLGPYAR